MSRKLGTVLGAGVVGAALVYLLATGIGDNLVYFLTPSELMAKGPEAYDVPFRLSGRVVPGSVSWNAETLELHFRVEDHSTALDVESTGTPPEMFHDGIDVVLEGSLSPDRVFRAHTLMVKHSNEYAPPEDHPADRFPDLPTTRGGPR
ncbi:MAG TPA: cytochrome c maturation protein CcmE [Longimicrobiales bacterium]|nr:cytochrome c maturation protein CcmE [Longimicrobiales bacterium]